MATQKGVIKLEGAVGDLSFYKRKGKYFARTKGGVSSDRIKNDPAFERTRENQQEFGRAGIAGKILRTSLREVILRSKDSGMTSRLTRLLMKVIQTDTMSERGQRTVQNGDISLLQNFEFNSNARLDNTIQMELITSIDRVTGVVEVSIPEFVPAEIVVFPAGATHGTIAAGACEIDFENQTFNYKVERSDSFSLDYSPQPAIQLSLALNPNTDKLIFVAVGIEFFQEVNGVNYPLKNGAFNALSLVKTDKPIP